MHNIEEKQKEQALKSQTNNKRPISGDEETREKSKQLKISTAADEELPSNRTFETTWTPSSGQTSQKLPDDSSQGATAVVPEKSAPPNKPDEMDTGEGLWDFVKPQPPKPPPLSKNNPQEPNILQQTQSLTSNVAKKFTNRSRSTSRDRRDGRT